MADLRGKRLGPYEIMELIGKGGMADVYRARQESVNRDVACKVIKTELGTSGTFIERFRREAQTVAALSHPHILKVFDYGQYEDQLYLIMELMTGGSLTSLLQSGPLPVSTTIRMFDQIASALDYAHRRGIIHRDLKPQNVLLDEDQNAMLTDFGIAKLLNSAGAGMTQTGILMGTPSYMPPEQWRADAISAQTDIYALGVMLFEMLTGQLPFTGETPFNLMYKHMNDQPPLVRSIKLEIPPAVDRVIDKALAKDPMQRYGSATLMASALRDALTERSTPPSLSLPTTPQTVTIEPISADTAFAQEAQATPSVTPTTLRRSNRPLILGGVISVGVLLLIGAVVALLAANSSNNTANATQTAAAIALVQPTQTRAATLTATLPATITPSPPTSVANSTSVPTLAPPTAVVIAITAASATPAALIASLSAPSFTPLPINTTPSVSASITTNIANIGTPIIIPPPKASDTIAPTATFTQTPLAPTASQTHTPIPPTILPTLTSTHTFTRLPPTATTAPSLTSTPRPTITPLPPSATNTLLPTATMQPSSTNTPLPSATPTVPPTFTRLPPSATLTATATLTFTPPPPTLTLTATTVPTATPIPGVAPTIAPSTLPTETPTTDKAVSKLAFLSKVSGRQQIYTINSDGSDVQQLTNATDFYPPPLTWSPDRQQIAFVVRTNTSQSIWVMGADGSNPTRFATGSYPAWSPDGKLIAYIGTQNGKNDVYVMTADGSNAHAVTSQGVKTVFIAWAADSKRLAFISDGVWVVDVSAAKPAVQRLNTDSRVSFIAWAPSGKQLAIVSGTSMYILNANGGQQQPLAAGSSPDWSPNGEQIVYSVAGMIYVVDASGANQKQLASGTEPVWSPSGEQIAYTSANTVYVMNADGTNQKSLGPGASPVWAP